MSILDATMLDCQDMASTARGMMVASCTRNNYQDMASLISRLQCFVDREAAFDLASSLNHVTKVYLSLSIKIKKAEPYAVRITNLHVHRIVTV